MEKRKFQCSDCEHSWEVAYGTSRPSECPKCKSTNIHRADEDKGFGRGGRGRRIHAGRTKHADNKSI